MADLGPNRQIKRGFGVNRRGSGWWRGASIAPARNPADKDAGAHHLDYPPPLSAASGTCRVPQDVLVCPQGRPGVLHARKVSEFTRLAIK